MSNTKIRRTNVILRSDQYSWVPWGTIVAVALIFGSIGGWWLYQQWTASEQTSAATISKLAADTDIWIDVTDTNIAFTSKLPGKPVTLTNVVARGNINESVPLVEQRDTFNSDVISSVMSGKPTTTLTPLTDASAADSPEVIAADKFTDEVVSSLGRGTIGRLAINGRDSVSVDGQTSRLVTFSVSNSTNGVQSGLLSMTPTASGNVVVVMVATHAGGDAQRQLFDRVVKETQLN
jgi:hypothetical protein